MGNRCCKSPNPPSHASTASGNVMFDSVVVEEEFGKELLACVEENHQHHCECCTARSEGSNEKLMIKMDNGVATKHDNNNNATSSVIIKSCQATNTTSSPSQILASNLSEDDLVQILTYLGRDCVRHFLAVKPLCQHFHLAQYYCPEHGSKRQANLKIDGDDEQDDDEEEEEDNEDKETEKEGEKEKVEGTGTGEEELGDKKDNTDEQDLKEISPSMTAGTAKDADTVTKMAAKKDEEEVSSKPKKLRCEDCVQAKLGRLRCPKCHRFEPEEDVTTCRSCNEKACYDCFTEEGCAGTCWVCDKFHCGRNDCPVAIFCEGCDSFSCLECAQHRRCGVCEEHLGCREDCLEYFDAFCCSLCEKTFCFPCKDHMFCESCDHFFCTDCRPSFYCEGCDQGFCDSCNSLTECKGCGFEACPHCAIYCSDCKEALCEDCVVFCCRICHAPSCGSCTACTRCDDCGARACGSCTFKCTECETITCPRCTKIYRCNECGKKICGDCQGVFHNCCCDKKGKFVLLA